MRYREDGRITFWRCCKKEEDGRIGGRVRRTGGRTEQTNDIRLLATGSD